MRPSPRYAAIVVLAAIVTLSAVRAAAAPATDEYIRGYAAAILTRDFRVRAPSLRVSRGVVHIASPDLASVDRAAVVAALGAIDGVTGVIVLDDQPPASAVSVAVTSVTAAAPAAPAAPLLLDTGFMPGGLLFRPLLADPRWPHFSLGYRKYFDEDDFDSVVAGSIGENLPLYRWTTSTAGSRFFNSRSTSTPDIPCMRMSSTATSTGSFAASSTASSPLLATSTR